MALQHELTSLAQRMGMSNLSLSREGVAALDIRAVGRVHFEQQDEDCLVYIIRPVFAHDRQVPRRILSQCHYDKAHPFPLQGGMHKDHALLLTRLPERAITAATLENALRFLTEQMDSLMQA